MSFTAIVTDYATRVETVISDTAQGPPGTNALTAATTTALAAGFLLSDGSHVGVFATSGLADGVYRPVLTVAGGVTILSWAAVAPAYSSSLRFGDARNSQYLLFPGLVGGGSPPAYSPRLDYSDARNSMYTLSQLAG